MPKDSSRTESINAGALARATDPKFISGVLSEHLPERLGLRISIDSLWIPRVIPRGKGGFAIQYNLKLIMVETQKDIILYGHLPGPDEKIPAYAYNKSVIFEKESGLIIPIFPYDPDLPSLENYFDEAAAAQKFEAVREEMELTRGKIGIGEIRLLGYRLGRRCVIAFSLSDAAGYVKRAVVKVIRGASENKPWDILWALEKHGYRFAEDNRLTVPHVYVSDPSGNAYIMEFVDGRSLHDLIGKDDFPAGIEGAGRALAGLHARRIPARDTHTYLNELQGLEEKFLSAAETIPERRDDYYRMYDELEKHSWCIDDQFTSAVIHRDFYDKQVLFTRERVTILDCDGVACGDPALDVGNFLAHLRLRALQSPDNARQLEKAAGNFAGAYGTVDDAFGSRVRWWMGATMLRLACLYVLRPRWRDLAPRLLDETQMILSGKINIGGVNDGNA